MTVSFFYHSFVFSSKWQSINCRHHFAVVQVKKLIEQAGLSISRVLRKFNAFSSWQRPSVLTFSCPLVYFLTGVVANSTCVDNSDEGCKRSCQSLKLKKIYFKERTFKWGKFRAIYHSSILLSLLSPLSFRSSGINTSAILVLLYLFRMLSNYLELNFSVSVGWLWR